jgi:hypothetical protein
MSSETGFVSTFVVPVFGSDFSGGTDGSLLCHLEIRNPKLLFMLYWSPLKKKMNKRRRKRLRSSGFVGKSVKMRVS